MSALVAQAAGLLATTPFADWLVRAQDQHLTGTLVLENPEGQRHGLYFEAGAPNRVKIASPVARLGEVLVERGDLSPERSADTIERARQLGILHGQLLLAEGVVDSRRLGEALREQLARQVVWLFGQPQQTRFGYFDAANFLVDWGAPPLVPSDPRQLLWRGIREQGRTLEIEQAVAQLVGHRLALRGDLPLAYFDFMGKEERQLIDLLRARARTINELLALSSASEEGLGRVLYFLVLSRSLNLGIPSLPPLGLDAVLDLAPETVAPGRAARMGRLALRSPTPTPAAASEPPKQDPVDEATNAEISFQRAEALLARGSFEAAEREARNALERDPQRPEHIALCAWFSAMKPEPNVGRLATEFNRALRLPGNTIKVRWYRGLVLKRLDRHADALREFRFVVMSDPTHVDAAREVRVYEARLRRSPKDRPSLAPDAPARRRSLLSWLFKRRELG